MNVPIDACENGNAAFALRVGYDGKCYPGNLGTGGGHFPATTVCVVYQLPHVRVRGAETATTGLKVNT